MKRRISILLLISMFLLTILSACSQESGRQEILKVMNWADYIDESLIPEFEQYYKEVTGKNIRVVYQTVENPQVMATKIESGKEDWDLACPSESIAERMLKNGTLLPIDTEAAHMENYRKYVSPYMKKAFADMESNVSPDLSKRYSVGYMWGTFGIMYNTDLVSEKMPLENLKNWDVMWNKDFSASILMKNSVREALPVALLYAYKDQLLSTLDNEGEAAYKQLLDDIFDLNKNTAEKISKVEDALSYQKNEVGILYETDDGKDGMVMGKYALDQAWNGDAVWAMYEASSSGVNLDFVIPEEGSNIWYDAWVIPKYARNKVAAEMFIDFLCNPVNATRNMDYIGYTSTTNSAEVIEWSFKTNLIDSALTENEQLAELYEDEDESFYELYDQWYENWYDNEYANWYGADNGEGLDLRYFFNEEGVATAQNLEYNGRFYHTDKILANSIQYPPMSDINRCAVMKGFSDNIEELNNMWIRVKGQPLPHYILVVMLCIIVVAVTGIFIHIRQKAIEKKKFSKLLIRRKLHNKTNNR